MLGASFFIASGVMVEAGLRARTSLIGLGLAAIAAVASLVIEDWLPVATAAAALFCVIVATRVRSAEDVSRAIFVAALSTALALQTEQFGERLAYLVAWDAGLAKAMIAAVTVGLSFAVAAAARNDLCLLPYGAVGAAALSADLLFAAPVWAAAGIVFLILRELRGPAALAIVSAAVVGTFASLSM